MLLSPSHPPAPLPPPLCTQPQWRIPSSFSPFLPTFLPSLSLLTPFTLILPPFQYRIPPFFPFPLFCPLSCSFFSAINHWLSFFPSYSLSITFFFYSSMSFLILLLFSLRHFLPLLYLVPSVPTLTFSLLNAIFPFTSASTPLPYSLLLIHPYDVSFYFAFPHSLIPLPPTLTSSARRG